MTTDLSIVLSSGVLSIGCRDNSPDRRRLKGKADVADAGQRLDRHRSTRSLEHRPEQLRAEQLVVLADQNPKRPLSGRYIRPIIVVGPEVRGQGVGVGLVLRADEPWMSTTDPLAGSGLDA